MIKLKHSILTKEGKKEIGEVVENLSKFVEDDLIERGWAERVTKEKKVNIKKK